MNIALKLTLDGLIEALRWKALERQKDDGRPEKMEDGRKPEAKGSEDNGK